MSLKNVLNFCGACIAFYIGAGFATMQEVMQYEASYGSRFWIVILVAALIYVYTNLSFTINGHRAKLKEGVKYTRYTVVSISVLSLTYSLPYSAI